MEPNIPRPEYPRPQFVRPDWLCLNGEWQFEIDQGDSGLERGLLGRELQDHITVPFCPESPLSGVHNHDFLNAVWYRRQVAIPSAWAERRVLLHFQAVDYDTTVWVNGDEVGRHRGGFTPFTCDLRDVAAAGETITIVVRARDFHREPQAARQTVTRLRQRGRAVHAHHRHLADGVAGARAASPMHRPRLTPDVANGAIRLEQPLSGQRAGLRLRATLRDAAGEVCSAECSAGDGF